MESPVSPEVRVFPELDALSKAVAHEVRGVLDEAVTEIGHGAIALAGGGTPKRLYQHLMQAHGDAMPWSKVHLFWGDERCVPPDHQASNVRMAREALIDHADIPEANLHVPPVAGRSPVDAAAEYEAELRAFFRDRDATPQGWPAFDLILLGIGGDGHTASLFPGSDALDAGDRWVVASQAPPEAEIRDRITLTMPVLNHARNVFVLTSGEAKRPVVREILETPEAAVLRYPAAQVHPRGRLVWWVDRAAIGLEGGAS